MTATTTARTTDIRKGGSKAEERERKDRENVERTILHGILREEWLEREEEGSNEGKATKTATNQREGENVHEML